jgi:hypothetical protein
MNTPFTKDTLHKSGQYLFLDSDLYKSEFIARFKYGKGPVTMAKFIKELIKNHTVEEYLKTLNHPDFSQRKAPLTILKDKNPTWYEELKQKFLKKNENN